MKKLMFFMICISISMNNCFGMNQAIKFKMDQGYVMVGYKIPVLLSSFDTSNKNYPKLSDDTKKKLRERKILAILLPTDPLIMTTTTNSMTVKRATIGIVGLSAEPQAVEIIEADFKELVDYTTDKNKVAVIERIGDLLVAANSGIDVSSDVTAFEEFVSSGTSAEVAEKRELSAMLVSHPYIYSVTQVNLPSDSKIVAWSEDYKTQEVKRYVAKIASNPSLITNAFSGRDFIVLPDSISVNERMNPPFWGVAKDLKVKDSIVFGGDSYGFTWYNGSVVAVKSSNSVGVVVNGGNLKAFRGFGAGINDKQRAGIVKIGSVPF